MKRGNLDSTSAVFFQCKSSKFPGGDFHFYPLSVANKICPYIVVFVSPSCCLMFVVPINASLSIVIKLCSLFSSPFSLLRFSKSTFKYSICKRNFYFIIHTHPPTLKINKIK